MPINCLFNLPRSTPVYYTGEQVSGSVTLQVDKKAAKLEGIKITLLGISKTQWTEPGNALPQIVHNDSTSRLTKPEKLSYSGTKIHINETQQLTGPIVILPGSIQLKSFEFLLPQTLPATCQMPHGTICYTLQVILERRSKHVKCFKQRLIIRKHIELEDLGTQTVANKSWTLSLPCSVFVPGQRVEYELKENKLTSSGKYLTRLCQCVTYQAELPEFRTKKILRILAESESMQNSLHLPLTAAIMSDPEAQDNPIHISYHIEAWSASDWNESLMLPLYVGTVAPPVCNHENYKLESMLENQSYCFVNFATTAVSQSELFPAINLETPHSCSKEKSNLRFQGHCENIELLKRHKKQSVFSLALTHFTKGL